MSIRTRLVFSVQLGCGQIKFTEFVRVPSHNLTHQMTIVIQSRNEGSFIVSIDDASTKLLQDRRLQLKYEVFQKLIQQSTHLHTKGTFSFSDRSTIHLHNNEYFLFVTIVDASGNEMSEITAVSDESNFGLRSAAFQRVTGDQEFHFKHNFSCLMGKLKMTCFTSLDNLNTPKLSYKLIGKKKQFIQSGIVSFHYSKMVSSSVKDRKFAFTFRSSKSVPWYNEHLVVISLGTPCNADPRYTINEAKNKPKQIGPAAKISEKIRNLISKAISILN